MDYHWGIPSVAYLCSAIGKNWPGLQEGKRFYPFSTIPHAHKCKIPLNRKHSGCNSAVRLFLCEVDNVLFSPSISEYLFIHIHVETMKSENKLTGAAGAGSGKMNTSIHSLYPYCVAKQYRQNEPQILSFTFYVIKVDSEARELSTRGSGNLSSIQQNCILWKLKSA